VRISAVAAFLLLGQAFLAPCPAPAAVIKNENQSAFDTADGKIVSSSAFIKLLRKELRADYGNLTVLVNACQSGEFTTRASSATAGLSGQWSLATGSDAKNFSIIGRTPDDEDIPHGPAKIPGLHQGDRWYHGFAAQFIKRMENCASSVRSLYVAGRDLNHRKTNPLYASSGAVADSALLCGSGHHAIVFASGRKAGPEMAQAMFDVLRSYTYSEENIQLLVGNNAGQGDVDANATLEKLEEAVATLGTRLRADGGEKTAVVFVDAEGNHKSRAIAYRNGFTPGMPGNGAILGPLPSVIPVAVDSTLMTLLKEETPKSGGGVWADDPLADRPMQPALRFATVTESVSGAGAVALYLDNVLLGQISLSGSPHGGVYVVPIPNNVLDSILPGLEQDSTLSVRFQFSGPSDSLKLATDDDFYSDSTYSHRDYGVDIEATVGAFETLQVAVPGLGPAGLVVTVAVLAGAGAALAWRRRRSNLDAAS
jgi:hypothetical protein